MRGPVQRADTSASICQLIIPKVSRKGSVPVTCQKYGAELNDIRVVWGDLKARHLARETCTDLDRLNAAIHNAVPRRPLYARYLARFCRSTNSRYPPDPAIR
jgi:hypothetical protein